MIRLVGVELTRLRWRRAVLALVAAAFVLPVLFGLGTAWNTRPYSEAEREAALAQASEQQGFQQEVRRCERHPRRMGVASAEACEDQILSWYSGLYRTPLDLAGELGNSGVAVASVLLIVFVLVGTTFAGADWNSGSMSNQLLFEPRRLRVWLAKGIAVGLAAVVISAVVMTLYWSGLHLLAAGRDLDAPPGLTGEVAWQVARATFLAGLGAVGGYALTMLFRSTVFTLSTMFALAVLSTFFVAALPLGANKERWLPTHNLLAIITGRASYYVEPPLQCMNSDSREWDREMRLLCQGQQTLSVWEGLAFVAVPFLVVVLASMWSFRRRDVP